MAAALMPQGKQQYFSSAGTPLVGGKVYTYAAGSTTPLATYTDAGGLTPNTNPVILDSRGEASIFFGGSAYKIVLQDSTGTSIWTQDNLTASSSSTLQGVTYADQFTGTGSQTVFTLSANPGLLANLQVSVDGLTYLPTTDYTWTSGTTLTFVTAPISGAQILAQYGASVAQGSNSFTSLNVIQSNTTAADFATGYFRRNTSHTGGTPGYVNSCLRADTYVLSSSVTDYEWAITGVVDNSAAAGQNVGGYFQGKKRSTGSTWGAVAEVIEINPTNDPTTGSVALEVDVSCNGTDNGSPYGSRVGVDLAIRKYVAGGAAANASWGYRVQNGGNADSVVGRGFGFAPGMICLKGFDASTATCITAAFQMETNQVFSLNSAGSRQLTHTGTSLLLKNPTGPVNYWQFNDAGTLNVLGTQLLGARSTGWGVASNGSKAAFNGSTATLAQTSAAVAQLIVDLTAHGLIGA